MKCTLFHTTINSSENSQPAERACRYFDFQFFMEKIRDNADDVIGQLMRKTDKTEEEKRRLQRRCTFIWPEPSVDELYGKQNTE